MLFGNPLLDELHILFKVMKGLKRDLEALGDKSILEDEVARERLVKHLGVLFGHFKHYSQKELELFAKDDISQHCSKLIQEIQFISGDDYKGLFYGRMPGKRAREGAMKVRELKDKINEAKLNLLEAEADVKFESKQKKKAIKLARDRSHLNLKEKGCYHFAHVDRFLHVVRNGLISLEYAQKNLNHDLQEATDNFQGRSFLSVFDTYSYWKLFQYFASHDLIDAAINGQLSKENFVKALGANKDLNFSKNANINVEVLRKMGFFNGNAKSNTSYRPFSRAIKEIKFGEIDNFPFNRIGVGGIVFLIDDTAHFFPQHENPFPFEGLFAEKIPVKKIIGLILSKEGESYKEYVREYVKYAGIPLYDFHGKLLWPTR